MSKTAQLNGKKAGIAFLIFGLITVLVGGLLFGNYATLKKTYIKTSGVVTDYAVDRQTNGESKTYYPIYSYNVDGESYTLRGKSGSSKKAKKPVDIYYNPSQPGTAFSSSDANGSLVIIGCGLAVTVLGVAVAVKAKKDM